MHVFGPFTDLLVSWYFVKNGMSAFLCLLLRSYYWQYMFCLDQCWIKITCSSHNLWHWEEITRWCMDLQWAIINATYFQHLALKSVYEKSQCIIGGKSFSSRAVFELAHVRSLGYLEQVNWIACMKHLLREALSVICQDGVHLHHFYVFYHYQF